MELNGVDPVRPGQRQQRDATLRHADGILLTSGRQPTSQFPTSTVTPRTTDVTADRVDHSSPAFGPPAGVGPHLPAARHRRHGVRKRSL